MNPEAVFNLHHDPGKPLARIGAGLQLQDGPEVMRAAVELPDTTEGRDAMTLVRSGVLRGFSLELEPTADRQDGDDLVIERAEVHGLALVARPAFGDSVVDEYREPLGTLRGVIPLNVDLACACSGPECDSARIMPGAIDVERVYMVTWKNYASPVGVTRFVKQGAALTWEMELKDSMAARQALDALNVVPNMVAARPLIDLDKSTSHIEGKTRVYDHAETKALLISATDQNGGWPVPVFDGNDPTRTVNNALEPADLLGVL